MHTSYAEFIRARREGPPELFPSQAALAEAFAPEFRVHQSRVSEWERGASIPNQAQAPELHRLLGLTPPEIAEAERLLSDFELGRMAKNADARRPAA